ncbi:DUF4132 domain-containing protein [Micromonospora sp. WMMB482]|nr:DUF4132 domain-containing protein [Micromonospora sp. WMMB482]
MDETLAWRERVLATGLTQPFKQAFREVYLLTLAEERTGSYSNRFAAHILRYRQANALMRARGWQAGYLGTWDGGYDSEATKLFGGVRGGRPSTTNSSTPTTRATTTSTTARPTRCASPDPTARPGNPRRSRTYRRWCSPRRCGTWTCSSASPRSPPTRSGPTAARTGSGTTGTAPRSAR